MYMVKRSGRVTASRAAATAGWIPAWSRSCCTEVIVNPHADMGAYPTPRRDVCAGVRGGGRPRWLSGGELTPGRLSACCAEIVQSEPQTGYLSLPFPVLIRPEFTRGRLTPPSRTGTVDAVTNYFPQTPGCNVPTQTTEHPKADTNAQRAGQRPLDDGAPDVVAQTGAGAEALIRQVQSSLLGGPDGRALVIGAFDLFETVLGAQRHLVDMLIARQRAAALQLFDLAGPLRAGSDAPK